MSLGGGAGTESAASGDALTARRTCTSPLATSAALAASVFHYGEQSVGDLKHFLAARGIPMRLTW